MSQEIDNSLDAAEDELYRQAVIKLARKNRLIREGQLEIDAEAEVSHGGDNGAYVQAWLWVDFAGTPFDKESDDNN